MSSTAIDNGGGKATSSTALSLPTSPLKKPGVDTSLTAGPVVTSGAQGLPTLLGTSSSTGTEKNKPPGSCAEKSKNSPIDSPMLLQAGNLVPLQDWMSVLPPSTILTSNTSDVKATPSDTKSISSDSPSGSSMSSISMKSDLSSSVAAGSRGAKEIHSNSIASENKLKYEIRSENKESMKLGLNAISKQEHEKSGKVNRTIPLSKSTISPIATANKTVAEHAAKVNVANRSVHKDSGDIKVVVPPAVPENLRINPTSGLVNMSNVNEMSSRKTPPLNHNGGATASLPSSKAYNSTNTPSIKVPSGNKVVKAAGSPRSSYKSKTLGSPKGNARKGQPKRGNSAPTAAEITAILINSTRVSCDLKKNENSAMKSPRRYGIAVNNDSAMNASKKPSKMSPSKLKVETDVIPLTLANSRNRSMTTGDLEAKTKAKGKISKAKIPKMTKLDNQSLTNLASLNNGSTPIKRPRRSSKGFMFVMNSRVYVPAERKIGIITEEKNGGWKYVSFELVEQEGSTSTTSLSPTYESDTSNSTQSNISSHSVPQLPVPSLHASTSETSVSALLSTMSVVSPRSKKQVTDNKGKWCRACDMREIGPGDVPLPNKADLLLNRSHSHPQQSSALPLDFALSNFTSGESDYGLDFVVGEDEEQDELMLLGRRVAFHHPVISAKAPLPGSTKRKRCESLDTGMRGMEHFFDYDFDGPDLVDEEWKLELGNFGGVFLEDDDDIAGGDC